jgi:hypothetical protein
MSIERTERATFRALFEATSNDWKIIERAERAYRRDHGPGPNYPGFQTSGEVRH